MQSFMKIGSLAIENKVNSKTLTWEVHLVYAAAAADADDDNNADDDRVIAIAHIGYPQMG